MKVPFKLGISFACTKLKWQLTFYQSCYGYMGMGNLRNAMGMGNLCNVPLLQNKWSDSYQCAFIPNLHLHGCSILNASFKADQYSQPCLQSCSVRWRQALTFLVRSVLITEDFPTFG